MIHTYNALDRFVHKAAFSGTGLQKAASRFEDMLFGDWISKTTLSRPVFITSLPRAGTTLLLDLIVRVSGFYTHTYRHMPFVLSPMLWRQMSARFRKKSVPVPRAHGDGMEIGFDSPEAFEEVVWLSFWKEKYAGSTIDLWSGSDSHPEFECFFRDHMTKVVLSQACDNSDLRYVSKNNANIARIPLLRRLFPDCLCIIPFREPLRQARSLQKQHLRFLNLHAADPFASQYMQSIGHFEFGDIRKHIDFPGLKEGADPRSIDYWLQYWTAAFAFILTGNLSNILFMDFDRLCIAPRESLGTLAAALRHPTAHKTLVAQASKITPAVDYSDREEFDAPSLNHARRIYDILRARTGQQLVAA